MAASLRGDEGRRAERQRRRQPGQAVGVLATFDAGKRTARRLVGLAHEAADQLRCAALLGDAVAQIRRHQMQRTRQRLGYHFTVARRRYRIGAARQDQHRHVGGGCCVERGRHVAHGDLRAGALVQIDETGAEARGRCRGALLGIHARHVFGAHHRKVHHLGEVVAHAAGQRRVQREQRVVVAAACLRQRERQHRGQLGRIKWRAQHAGQHRAIQQQVLGLAGERMGDRHAGAALRDEQQALQVGVELRIVGAAAGVVGAGGQQRFQRGVGVDREARRKRHRGRCHAVEHHAAHMLRELAQVLERRARAVGAAPQVDARRPERGAHRIEVAHRDPGRVLAQVGARLQRLHALAQLRHRARWIHRLAQDSTLRVRSHSSALDAPVPRWST
jgi:hypothetical protein